MNGDYGKAMVKWSLQALVIVGHYLSEPLANGTICVRRPIEGISTKIAPLKVGTPFLGCYYGSGIIANNWKLRPASAKNQKT